MKKLLIALLGLLLCCALAFAETGMLRVTNCQNWVSLYERPDKSSARLAEVPLNAPVSDYEPAENGFIECSYQGMRGYILSEYLVSEDGSPVRLGDMKVIKCNEYVSLRKRPDKSSSRLEKVPLNSIVNDCTVAENGFIACSYNGVKGYVLQEYLTPYKSGASGLSYEELIQTGRTICNKQIGDHTVVASISSGSFEILKLGVYDDRLNCVWSYTTRTKDANMLSYLDAFVAGTRAKPLVVVFNGQQAQIAPESVFRNIMEPPQTETPWNDADRSVEKTSETPTIQELTAFDLYTGEIVWSLSGGQTGLSSGIVHKETRGGLIYVGGYFGPDPICISAEGKILARAKAPSDDYFWLYRIIPKRNGIVALYESGPDGEMSTDQVYEAFYEMPSDSWIVYSEDALPSDIADIYENDVREDAIYEIMNSYEFTDEEYEGIIICFAEGYGEYPGGGGGMERSSALCVVWKGGEIIFASDECATYPDFPTDYTKNGTSDSMPTLIDGKYQAQSTSHLRSLSGFNYPALKVLTARLCRINASGYYLETKPGDSSTINIHAKSENRLNNNSDGCTVLGMAELRKNGITDLSSANNFTRFAYLIGFAKDADGDGRAEIKTGAPIINKTCTVVYNRSYGYDHVPEFKQNLDNDYKSRPEAINVILGR